MRDAALCPEQWPRNGRERLLVCECGAFVFSAQSCPLPRDGLAQPSTGPGAGSVLSFCPFLELSGLRLALSLPAAPAGSETGPCCHLRVLPPPLLLKKIFRLLWQEPPGTEGLWRRALRIDLRWLDLHFSAHKEIPVRGKLSVGDKKNSGEAGSSHGQEGA